MSAEQPPDFLDALRALYTVDVDATLTAPREPLERMFDVLARHRIVPRIDSALAFARDRQVMLLRHGPTPSSDC